MVSAPGTSCARCALSRWRHRAGVVALSLAALMVGSRTTQDAVANGDEVQDDGGQGDEC